MSYNGVKFHVQNQQKICKHRQWAVSHVSYHMYFFELMVSRKQWTIQALHKLRHIKQPG